MPITWTNEKRKLSQLNPWERNPRQIKVDQAKDIIINGLIAKVKRLEERLNQLTNQSQTGTG